MKSTVRAAIVETVLITFSIKFYLTTATPKDNFEENECEEHIIVIKTRETLTKVVFIARQLVYVVVEWPAVWLTAGCLLCNWRLSLRESECRTVDELKMKPD